MRRFGVAEAAAEGVGEALDLLDRDRAAGGEGGVHGGAAVHRDADDAGRRVGGLDRERDAGGEAAAGERHEDGGEVGAVLDQLEAGGALAGDDVAVVEGRDLGEALGRRRGGGDSAAASSWVRPAMRTSAPRARIAATLAAGTRADMQTTARRPRARAAKATARPWLPVEQQVTPGVSGGQAGDGVEGAAELEGADRLGDLELEQEVGVARAEGTSGRADGAAGDGAAGGEDVGEGEREGQAARRRRRRSRRAGSRPGKWRATRRPVRRARSSTGARPVRVVGWMRATDVAGGDGGAEVDERAR